VLHRISVLGHLAGVPSQRIFAFLTLSTLAVIFLSLILRAELVFSLPRRDLFAMTTSACRTVPTANHGAGNRPPSPLPVPSVLRCSPAIGFGFGQRDEKFGLRLAGDTCPHPREFTQHRLACFEVTSVADGAEKVRAG
jgi:hypothetical protein